MDDRSIRVGFEPFSSAEEAAEYNRMTRLQLSVSDFGQAMSAATFLLQDLEDDVPYTLGQWRRFRCYETTMVVAYARPFSTSRGAAPAIGLKAIGLKLMPIERALHDKVVEHRNTVYGHSDAGFVELRRLHLHTPRSEAGPEVDVFVPRFEERTRFDLEEILAIYELCAKLHHHAFLACQTLGRRFEDRYRSMQIDLGATP